MLTGLFDHFMQNPEKLPDSFIKLLDRFDRETVVCDYISSMTDRYAIAVFENVFVPKSFFVKG